MPTPVPDWVDYQPLSAKSLNLALVTADGTADNLTGAAFMSYRPVLFEAYTRAATFPSAPGGSQTTMASSGTVTSGVLVCDTAGYYGLTSDLPGTGYYSFTAVVPGSAGDGVTPGGWMMLSHFPPLAHKATQTAVGADWLHTGGAAIQGGRQAASTGNDNCPFFLDLQNVGINSWQPAVTVADSATAATTNALNAFDPSGETPRMFAVWAGVAATTDGQATFTQAGTFAWTAPSGVTSVTASPTGSGAGSGAGNASAGGVDYGGGGAGGGEYASGAVAVTPGNNYAVTVGAAGAGGTSPGGSGGAGASSVFTGDAASITAHGGSAGAGATTSGNGAAGAGGTGSSATTHHNGGAGAAGATAASGGGGGSSAGASQAGNAGHGASGGSAPSGGGPGGAGGTLTIRVVQSASGWKGNVTSFTLRFPAPVQAGNTVIACVCAQSFRYTTAPTGKLSDGTVMNQETSASIQGNGQVSANFAVLDVFSVTGGQTGVTVTGVGASDRVFSVQMWEVSGLGQSPQVDVSNTATGQSSTYAVSQDTNKAPEFWVGSVGTTKNSQHSVNAATGNWISFAQTGGAGSGTGGTFYSHLRSGYQIVAAAGAMKYTGKLSASDYWAAGAVSYASSVAASGTSPLIAPGGGAGGGLGPSGDGAAGRDGSVTLTWTGASGSGYSTPALPTPAAFWDPGTAISATGLPGTVALNGPSGIRDVANFLANPPMVRLAVASGATIPTSSLTQVPLNGALLDNYSGWNSATSTYTVQRDGLYMFHAMVPFTQNSTGTRLAAATINGVSYWGPGYVASSSTTTGATKTQIFSLQAGDTVQVSCRQDSGGNLTLSGSQPSRMFMVWLCAPGLPVQQWSPPDTTFRWASGTDDATLTAQFQQHLANDLGFLVQHPALMAYQSTAQSGLAAGSFSTVTLDMVGGIVHGDSGDTYAGWTAGVDNAYTAPCDGWYLVVGEFLTTSTAGAGATVTAGVAPVSSGGVFPQVTPDYYQAMPPTSTSSAGGGGSVFGLYYLQAGEPVTPQVMGTSFSAPYGTLTGTANGGVRASHLEILWLSE